MKHEEILKTAKPILFNAEMVKAILDGRKTVTRRVIKNNPCECTSKQVNGISKICDDKGGFYLPEEYVKVKSPIQVSDILYVRETWSEDSGVYIYKTNCRVKKILEEVRGSIITWRPSIHMPKEAARIFLRVTNVSVAKLRPMGFDDFESEGLDIIYGLIATTAYFANLWNSSIRKSDLDKYGWDANPWVWVIEFEKVEVG